MESLVKTHWCTRENQEGFDSSYYHKFVRVVASVSPRKTSLNRVQAEFKHCVTVPSGGVPICP